MAPTTQLKKRAAESGMDNVDESFVKIGTALPALSSNKVDKNEFVPVWQQEVKDEQGRRRLHGAFTGGFSAGYFNTVGSKEGWTPANFKSSLSEKKKIDSEPKMKSGSRPEDFMDAEDLAELESRKELRTNSQFDSTIGRTSVPSAFLTPQYDPLTGDLGTSSDPSVLHQLVGPSRAEAALSNLIQPNTSKVGHKLMQKMGWRHGQGIGPRITFERKKQLAQNLGIPICSTDDDEDTERRKHLFPPLDRPLGVFQRWSGNAGLGYHKATHSLRLDQSFSRAGPSAESVAGVSIDGQTMPKGASFGLGALNDFEDDDHDIYDSRTSHISKDPRARRLLVLDEENTSHQASISHPRPPRSHHQLVPSAQTNFSDGTRIPQSFRLSRIPSQSGAKKTDTWYTAPTVPDGWEPNPSKVWVTQIKGPNEAESDHSSRRLTQSLSAGDRGRILGEKQPPKSVFEFISAKDKARLEKVKQQNSPLSPGLPAGPTSSQFETPVNVPTLPPTIAQAALRGFMPFSHDLSKQQRYRLYLQSQAGMLSDGAVFAPKPSPRESVDQINKELEGFAKSAMMFKPMSAMMASRFTSAASNTASGELFTPQPGLRQPVFSEEQPTLSEEKVKVDSSTVTKAKEEISQAAQAVRMDMFGMLTRTTVTFYPQKLLCKRLNVPNPFPNGEPTGAKPKVATNKMADFLTAHGFQPAISDLEKVERQDEKTKSDDWITQKVIDGPAKPLDQVGLGDDETQGRDILTTTRPAIDLFKAIFADDSEDDEQPPEVEEGLASTQKNTLMSLAEDVPETARHEHDTMNETSTTDPAVDQRVPATVPSLIPKVVDSNELEKLASFRPTFSRKTDKSTDLPADKDEEPIGKTKKKSKKRTVLMSFEDEDAEPVKDKSKVKKKKARQSDEGKKSLNLKDKKLETKEKMKGIEKTQITNDLDDQWVEKLPNKLQSDTPSADPVNSLQKEVSVGPPTNESRNRRLRASDLMDD
ncbi:hypothetical protein CROQUDRAFT_658316 [Cronartium quercuum f. sp. fusiforme G11]|uniref:G-patch domain-containing protein n=1 Tax=Cronartium quercuum f. sp. fusiforme G11 TaxID=708437 RepID=A0A9P6NK55_9BASI|nr:hypothetical protein CROQUDRAFT_658316 [Cronartium quercuum f. sp. fusiforme G11]